MPKIPCAGQVAFDFTAPRKRCSRCGETKPLDGFSKHPKMALGRQSQCKRCVTDRKVAQYRADPEGVNAARRERRAKNPAPYKETARRSWERHRDTRIADLRAHYQEHRDEARAEKRRYYQARCEVIRAKHRAYYWANSQKVHAYSAQWRNGPGRAWKRAWQKTPLGKAASARASHKRRQGEKSTPNTLTAQEWASILEEQEYRCLSCKHPFSGTLHPTRDHVLPVSKGGGLTRENCAALCQSCNSRKGNR